MAKRSKAKKNGTQYDLFGARAERDLGIDRVTTKCQAWITRGITLIRQLPPGYEGIAEEICRELKLGAPPSPGAVGAMTRYAAKSGLLIRTKEMRQPTSVRSHARATYVWRKL